MILLDTSVLLAAYGRRAARGAASTKTALVEAAPAAAALRRLIQSGAPLAIPAVVVQEVLAAVPSTPQFDELRSHLAAYTVLPATLERHVRAARIAGQCSARKIPCSTVAALVVAQALLTDSELLTLDAELSALARFCGVKSFDLGRLKA